MILQANALSKEFGKGGALVRAVDEVSLDVAAGETVAIMGPSGCGKSTLLHLRRHDPDLDLETILDHLAGVSVFADEDFAGYGLDEPRIAELRSWVTGWYDDLARRLTAELADDELPDDL